MNLLSDIYFFIISPILGLLVLLILIGAVLSWLYAFGVVSPYNQFAQGFSRFYDAVVGPILRPIQKIIPSIGGMDFSPMILILLIEYLRRSLFPQLIGMVSSSVPVL